MIPLLSLFRMLSLIVALAVVGVNCTELRMRSFIANARAVVHIGPWKTGTTSLQYYVVQHKEAIRSKSYNWLGNCAKAHRVVVDRLREVPESVARERKSYLGKCLLTFNQIDNFIRTHRQKRENVLFSSEDFSLMSSPEIESLRKFLQGYEITIIMVYRYWGIHLYSFFNQFAKTFRGSVFFDDWLALHHASTALPRPPLMSTSSSLQDPDTFPASLPPSLYEDLLDRFGAVFGHANMRVVDYYGARVQHRQLEQIILCDVMASCDRRVHPTATSNPHNPSADLTAVQLVYVLQQYVRAHNCTFRVHHRRFLDKEDAGSLWEEPLPVVTRTLPPELLQISRARDRSFRAKVAALRPDMLLYGDSTTNAQSTASFMYTELDSKVVADSEK